MNKKQILFNMRMTAEMHVPRSVQSLQNSGQFDLLF